MFKRVFAKYVTAFMLITATGFLLLLLIISSIVTNYSVQSKANLMENVADVTTLYLEIDAEEIQSGAFFLQTETERGLLELLDRFSDDDREDMQLWIADKNGYVVASLGDEQNVEELLSDRRLPDEQTQKAIAGESAFHTLTSKSNHAPTVICVKTIETAQNEVCGFVAVCSANERQVSISNNLFNSVLVSALMVLIATLIAAYLLTERITGPLREMSAAARSFAAGNFDSRVRVRGKDEVAELAVAFNHMADSLQNLETMRNSFIANVSHDLRTPMTTIAGFIDSIREGAIPPNEQDHYLQIVSEEVHRLSRLVSSLLDISRLQAGDRKFTMKPFDICEMARLILISFEQKIEEKKLDVVFECDEDRMLVCADRDAIYQVFYNLCHNALKFSSQDGMLRIRIQKMADKKVKISIYNEGEGIAQEELGQIFERFYKIDKSRGMDKNGAGLGLYIAKTIMSAHGEEIWVASEQGRFCEFFFTLPVAARLTVEK